MVFNKETAVFCMSSFEKERCNMIKFGFDLISFGVHHGQGENVKHSR